MNIFRLAGDVSHLVAILILLMKIWSSRSCAGISGKSQVLFALVFTTRYLDLFTVYISAYNSVMKVVFLALSYATVYLIYMRFKNTYNSENDTFRACKYFFKALDIPLSSLLHSDLVDLLHLPGVRCHNAPALHDHKDRRGGVHHHPLPVLPRPLQSPLHSQLGVALPHGGLLRPDRRRVRSRSDHFLLRLLLSLRHEGAPRKRKDEPADSGLDFKSVPAKVQRSFFAFPYSCT
ncbi:hypothetical protein XENOCAPTIV_018670 [Xenoophorus captivus]|uniref:ER lumen protein-retaining receptor n=1 Tax=Xenoophorus captivus TaxID=1517983 RepID=A0ABV0QAM3_9TELE